MISTTQPLIILLNFLRKWGQIRWFRFVPHGERSSLSIMMFIERDFYLIQIVTIVDGHFYVSCWDHLGESPRCRWSVELLWYEQSKVIYLTELKNHLNTLVVRHIRP